MIRCFGALEKWGNLIFGFSPQRLIGFYKICHLIYEIKTFLEEARGITIVIKVVKKGCYIY